MHPYCQVTVPDLSSDHGMGLEAVIFSVLQGYQRKSENWVEIASGQNNCLGTGKVK